MGLFFLPQIGTDLYSLNTNRTNYKYLLNPFGIRGRFIRWQRYKNDRNSGLNMFRPFLQKYILF